MEIPVNKDPDSYHDDFFKGLSLRQTSAMILSVAAGTGTFLLGIYVLALPQVISFYLALPAVLPIAVSAFLKIHGMPPFEYLRKRRRAYQMDIFYFTPALIGAGQKEETQSLPQGKKKIRYLDEEVTDNGREEDD